MPASSRRPTAPKPGWCTPARCARNSARPPKRCSSPKATSIESAEECEARFSGKAPGYVYSRYSNPTMSMFEQRMAALEGAEAARSTATGMAAVTTALMGLVQGRRSRRRRQGAVRLLPLGDRGMAAALRRHLDAGRRQGSRCLEDRRCARTPKRSSWRRRPIRRWKSIDIAGGRRHRAQCRRQAGGRQCVRHAALPEPAGARRRLRGLFGDQAHRRPGPRARRRDPGVAKSSSWTMYHQLIRQTGPSLSPFNAWVLLKGLETLPVRVERQTETAGAVSSRARRPQEAQPADLSRPRRSSAGRHRHEADEGRLDARVRSRSRAARTARSVSSMR